LSGGRSQLLLRRIPFPAILALRYLKSTRKDAYASFLSAVAAGGIGLGVAALVLSLAVISGFQEALRGEILSRTAQIEVDLPPADIAAAAAAAAAKRAVLAVPGVTSAQVQVAGNGWLVSRGKVEPAELVGFEGRVPASFPGAAGYPEGLYVEGALAARWGLVPGQVIQLVSPKPTLAPIGGPQPRLRSLPISGTFKSGRTQEEQERVALPLATALTLLGTAELRLDVAAADLDTALDVAKRLPAVLPRGSEVRTWKDLNRPLLFALRLEKVMMFVAVFLIVFVAELALMADLALIISSKRPEIGMLGAMGANAGHLRSAFLLLGGLVAGLGAFAGAGLGAGGAWVLDHYKLVPVPGRVYFLEYVPFLVKPGDLALVLLLTLGLALLTSLYAAQRAATLDPIEAMRR
jgi:lipoprotein-releasing system permease protein